jgi:hypothetical protein
MMPHQESIIQTQKSSDEMKQGPAKNKDRENQMFAA